MRVISALTHSRRTESWRRGGLGARGGGHLATRCVGRFAKNGARRAAIPGPRQLLRPTGATTEAQWNAAGDLLRAERMADDQQPGDMRGWNRAGWHEEEWHAWEVVGSP